jgi:probable DNA metabolism protein
MHPTTRRMKRVLLEPDFTAWRLAAREALRAGYTPTDLDLQDALTPAPLTLEPDQPPTGSPIPQPHTTRTFLDVATLAAAHRDPTRWNLLYRILYRLQAERDLLHQDQDPDILHLQHLAAQVRRDRDRMQAFLRFHKVFDPTRDLPNTHPIVEDEPLIPTTPDCDHYIAWYHPEHRILPITAPFFADRFNILRWTILTPDASATWNPDTQQLTCGPGITRPSPPSDIELDELESLWRTHHATQPPPPPIEPHITPMPPKSQPTALPFLPAKPTLASIRKTLPACRGCDLYRHATHAVPGTGDPASPLVLIGEQPGDQEDLQALPFVGPAGQLLDRILAELSIPRSALYLTNAVKHFKFLQRGKKRLHDTPRISEINACRPWLTAELALIKPRVVLCLGASASKSLLGGTFTLMQHRGQFLQTPYAAHVMATIHPSAILRARDQPTRHQLHQFLKEDLALAHQTATHPTGIK